MRTQPGSSSRRPGILQDFVHEKLDVYQAALAFLVPADEILEEDPRGRGHLG